MNIHDEVTQFVTTYTGKNLDFDGVYGGQCVDVTNKFAADVLSVTGWKGNAVDKWTNYPEEVFEQIPNTPEALPQEGDTIIWGKTVGEYGHIALALAGATTTSFDSFDQNWPVGSVCHTQHHTYKGVLGWLRPRNINTMSDPKDTLAITQLNAEVAKREILIGQLNNEKDLRDQTIKDLTQQLDQAESAIAGLQNKIKNKNTTPETVTVIQTVTDPLLVEQINTLKAENATLQEAVNGTVSGSDTANLTIGQLFGAIWNKIKNK